MFELEEMTKNINQFLSGFTTNALTSLKQLLVLAGADEVSKGVNCQQKDLPLRVGSEPK